MHLAITAFRKAFLIQSLLASQIKPSQEAEIIDAAATGSTVRLSFTDF